MDRLLSFSVESNRCRSSNFNSGHCVLRRACARVRSQGQLGSKRAVTMQIKVPRSAWYVNPLWMSAGQAFLNLGQLFFQQLFVVEVSVVSVLREQFVVCTQFDDPSAV